MREEVKLLQSERKPSGAQTGRLLNPRNIADGVRDQVLLFKSGSCKRIPYKDLGIITRVRIYWLIKQKEKKFI